MKIVCTSSLATTVLHDEVSLPSRLVSLPRSARERRLRVKSDDVDGVRFDLLLALALLLHGVFVLTSTVGFFIPAMWSFRDGEAVKKRRRDGRWKSTLKIAWRSARRAQSTERST